MARKEADVTITEEGRDFQKVFHITEMSAVQAEKWATRALLALAHAGADLGDAMGAGMQGIAAAGINALTTVSFYEPDPLLDELMTCITIKPSAAVVRALMEEDIEEVATRIRLKFEVLQLHVGFSLAGNGSKSTLEMPAKPPASSNTSTSHDPSVRFSRSPKIKPAR